MQDKQSKSPMLEQLTKRMTEWMGTPVSIIIHTFVFGGIFLLRLFGVPFEQIMLILTTAVSLEAIYLALFIQMTVNRNTLSLEEVEEDIEEIQEDVEGVEKDIDEIQEDVEDVEQDIDSMQKDVGELEEDMDDISQDIDKIQESHEGDDGKYQQLGERSQVLMAKQLQVIMTDLKAMRKDLDTMKKQIK